MTICRAGVATVLQLVLGVGDDKIYRGGKGQETKNWEGGEGEVGGGRRGFGSDGGGGGGHRKENHGKEDSQSKGRGGGRTIAG